MVASPPSASAFLLHTAWLCAGYGAVFCLVCPRLDALLGTNLHTPEARLFARHLGLALFLVAVLCLRGLGCVGGAADDAVASGAPGSPFPFDAVLAWHVAVIAAFAGELGWDGAFRASPRSTRWLTVCGVAAHVALLIEGWLARRSGSRGEERSSLDVGAGSPLGLMRGSVSAAIAIIEDARGLASTTTALCFIVAAALSLFPAIFHARRRRRRRIGTVEGSLVVITGAAGGIGRELALAFARRGARLALWDIREDALSETPRWLASRGAAGTEDPAVVRTTVVDVSDADSVGRAAEALREAEGGRAPRVVVSNAAVMRGKTLLGSSDGELRGDFAVNALAALWVHRSFLRQVAAMEGVGPRGDSHREEACVLVTMGSIMAELPAARQTEYCSSKAALSQLHACLRWELRAAGLARRVRTLLVQPYAVRTSMVSGAALLGEGEESKHRRFALMGRVLPPLDPAEVACRVVEAVELGEERVYIPWIVGWIPTILNLLPIFASDWLLSLAGALDGADGIRSSAPVR